MIYVGSTIRLVRRFSSINGYSLAEKWDGKIAKIIEIEPRENGSLTVECEGDHLCIFRDAVGELIDDVRPLCPTCHFKDCRCPQKRYHNL